MRRSVPGDRRAGDRVGREVRVRHDEHVAVAHGPQAAQHLRVQPMVDPLEHLVLPVWCLARACWQPMVPRARPRWPITHRARPAEPRLCGGTGETRHLDSATLACHAARHPASLAGRATSCHGGGTDMKVELYEARCDGQAPGAGCCRGRQPSAPRRRCWSASCRPGAGRTADLAGGGRSARRDPADPRRGHGQPDRCRLAEGRRADPGPHQGEHRRG